jgi:DNA invertase Pin-like site-specific DNA recombinase
MIVGYPRTSTVEHQAGFDAQVRELEKAGCELENIFKEQVSSVAERAQLKAALNFVRKGDVFVVTKIDRLARSITNLMEIIGVLERKKVAVRILDPAMDTETSTGKLMLTLLGGIAEYWKATRCTAGMQRWMERSMRGKRSKTNARPALEVN